MSKLLIAVETTNVRPHICGINDRMCLQKGTNDCEEKGRY